MLGVLILVSVAGAPALDSYPEASPANETLTLAAGATVKVRLRVPVTGPPSRYCQVLVRSSGWSGIAEVLPLGEVAKVELSPPAVEVTVLVSANAPTSRAYSGAIRVVVHDPNLSLQVGDLVWRPRLRVEPLDPAPPVEPTADALRQARRELEGNLGRAGPVADQVRSTGMAILRPETAQWNEALTRVIRSMGRVQALSAQLRAVGLGRGPDAEASALALATNRGPARRPLPRTLDRASPARGLKRAEALLKRLQFERALGWCDALIDSGRLQRRELAQALVLRATIQALGGFEQEARVSYGRASCIDTVARPPDRPLFEEAFDRLARPPACVQTLNAQPPYATRVAGPQGVTLKVGIPYGPDPFGIVTGGTVQLLDPRGVMLAQQAAIAEIIDDQPVLVAEFSDDGQLADPTGRVYVAGNLDGPGRVNLVDVGTPEPEVVTVEDENLFVDGGVPTWLWITLGVVAVGGATAAVIAVTSDGDPTDAPRGIGPVEVTF